MEVVQTTRVYDTTGIDPVYHLDEAYLQELGRLIDELNLTLKNYPLKSNCRLSESFVLASMKAFVGEIVTYEQ